MTPSQVDAAGAVLRLTRALGYPPSWRELGAALGLCKRAVGYRLAQTARLGLTMGGGVADQRTTAARPCRCGSGAAFLPVGKVRGGAPGSRNLATASRDGVCPRCSGVVLLAGGGE